MQFLIYTTFEPTEEIDLRYLSSFFLLSAGFWRCQNSFTSILHSAQAWGLFSWTYTSKYSKHCAVRHM